ncbi:hypothetical protein EV426DRAFT_599076 [Tirmania nivea]|nr:hypothetical protein EV426DRAFT_599076 [Tirmania nivea]
MNFDTFAPQWGSHNGPVVDKPAVNAVPDDLLTRIYKLCTDGYEVLLVGTLDIDIRSRLDSEYARLQLWGIDTGILKGKLSVLRAHPLYKTAGLILLKIMQRLAQLGDAYLTVDDDAKDSWRQRTSEYILEVPSFFQAPRGQEDINEKLSEDKDHTLTVEQKVQRLHDAFWAEREEQKVPRGQVSAPGVTVEDEEECLNQERSKQEQAAEGCSSGIELVTESEYPPIHPSDSASQTGTHESQMTENISFSKPEIGKPSSTALSSGHGSSSSSGSSIVVLRVIESLAVFNNCLFSIVKEMDMAMADYGKGPLSQLYAAVKVIAGETTTVQSPGRSGVNSPEPSWQPQNITTISDLPPPPLPPLSPPPPPDSKTPSFPQPNSQVKPGSKQALPPNVLDKKNLDTPPEKRQQSTQDSTIPPTFSLVQPPSEQSNFEPYFNREKIVAAAMTNDKSLFDLMHTYAGMGLEATDVGFGLFCEKYQELVSVSFKQTWLSLDLAMCMWKNASAVIRNKFKELAKCKLQDLKKVDEEMNRKANFGSANFAYPSLDLLPYQKAIENAAGPRQLTPASVYGRDRYYPGPKITDSSRDHQNVASNMADFVYEIPVSPSPYGSQNGGGGDDRGKNYYDDYSRHSVGRLVSTKEQRRATSGGSRDKRDQSRPQSTYYYPCPARSRSSRSRTSTYGRRYHGTATSPLESSDEYENNTASRPKKRSPSLRHNESHEENWFSDDYDGGVNLSYDFNRHHHKSHNSSATTPWAASTTSTGPSPLPPGYPPAPPPNPAPVPPPTPVPTPQHPFVQQNSSRPLGPYISMHDSQRSEHDIQDLQRPLEAAKGSTEKQQQQETWNQSTSGLGRSPYAPSSCAPSINCHPHGAAVVKSAIVQSETPRDQPRSILRTSSLPLSSSAPIVQDSVSRESHTKTRAANNDFEHRLSTMENILAILPYGYRIPPPPPVSLSVIPGRKQKSVSIPIPENHAI